MSVPNDIGNFIIGVSPIGWPVEVSISEDEILTGLRAFLLSLLPQNIEVIRGQDNRVPEPQSQDFIIMTPAARVRIATNVTTWDNTDPAASTINTGRGSKITFQLDCHGPNGADICQMIATLWRDDFACQYFTDAGLDMQPLYATDGQQIPFLNGEEQYEDRWVMELDLQVNLIVSTPQEFADTLAVTLIEVDSAYPPGD